MEDLFRDVLGEPTSPQESGIRSRSSLSSSKDYVKKPDFPTELENTESVVSAVYEDSLKKVSSMDRRSSTGPFHSVGPKGSGPGLARLSSGKEKVRVELEDDKPAQSVLRVTSIDFFVTDREIMDVFSRVGPVRDVRFKEDKVSGRSKEEAYVEFYDVESAKKAVEKLQGHKFRGRACVLIVLEGSGATSGGGAASVSAGGMQMGPPPSSSGSGGSSSTLAQPSVLHAGSSSMGGPGGGGAWRGFPMPFPPGTGVAGAFPGGSVMGTPMPLPPMMSPQLLAMFAGAAARGMNPFAPPKILQHGKPMPMQKRGREDTHTDGGAAGRGKERKTS
eukprot:TRINITY_DN80549_c0_g1_i1.p1 TRINITY_DN80549_c0_g1~~TRINITY_DN80549_c0_g1_i1.p1  ORF type:complete len:332 (-),score=102.22 TRINITY_DN80549_c0_g1_i1:53-1048(-)